MPTTTNTDYLQMSTVPDDIGPTTEVFYVPSTNEIFLEYNDYFDRMIQLNSACWICTITGKSGLTYDEALQSENTAMEQINNFPTFLESPILFLVHRYTCRSRFDEIVNDVMAFMKDRFFMDEEIVYRHTLHKRFPARIIGINYNATAKKTLENGGTSGNKEQKSPKKSFENLDMELCPPECFTYTLQILNQDDECDTSSASSRESNDERNNELKDKVISHHVHNVPYIKICRGKVNYATRPRIKLFIRYHTEMAADGHLVIKHASLMDFDLNNLTWVQIFTESPEPKFPETHSYRRSKLERISLAYEEEQKRRSHNKTIKNNDSKKECLLATAQPSTSKQQGQITPQQLKRKKSVNNESLAKKAAEARQAREEMQRQKIKEQQTQLDPLFKQAERFGVENLEHWQQTLHLLSEDDIQNLRNAIGEAKELERKKQIERRRREREFLLEWRKPRDDLLCDDLKPFPPYKELCWPDWVPSEFYWDILSIQSFLQTFADVIFLDKRNPFTLTSIATAILSHQTTDACNFYQLMDWLLTAAKKCLDEDEGDAADLNRPDQIGNELNKDIDHPIHGEQIRRINEECERQKKIHGVHIRGFTHERLLISEIIRLHLKTSGYYTMWRRQLRGMMHCYEDDGYIFVRNEPEIMKLLKVSSIFALNPIQRVKLINVFINQLLSHQRFRNLIDQRIDELHELKKELRRLKAVDQQHERDAREAQQTLVQSDKTTPDVNDMINGISVTDKTLKTAKKELESLRRALTQLNEGRRVQNITELRERLLSETNPLPWSLMQSGGEIQEFRAAQRNFHGDKIQDVVRQIYELQGKMGMYYLGKDRAYRNYYYICSAFIIYCPLPTELGCCIESTSIQTNNAKPGEKHVLPTKINEEKVCENNGNLNNFNNHLSNGYIMGEKREGMEVEEQNSEKTVEQQRYQRPIDCFMACTGQPQNCPVHNPPAEWPRLLFYIEQDAVKKLLDSLNPRGFRESELAENIVLFKEIYAKEMAERLDNFTGNRSQLPLSAQLFGFSATLPKELINSETTEDPAIAKFLWVEVRDELLEIEKIIFERRVGVIYCTVDREQWRQMLKETGDTSQCCVDNCILVKFSTTDQNEMLYTADELSQPERLTSVQKLGIALLQLAQGIHSECLQHPFMNETKRNGTVVKRTPKETFIEWQRALKRCQSPSAIALFEATFEYAVNWDYLRPEEIQQQTSTSRKVGGRRQQQQFTAVPSAETAHSSQTEEQQLTTRSRNYQYYPSTRSQRELASLMENANYAGLLVTGTRHRKQVTKYGDCEMDIDKLDFEDDDYEDAHDYQSDNDDDDDDDDEIEGQDEEIHEEMEQVNF